MESRSIEPQADEIFCVILTYFVFPEVFERHVPVSAAEQVKALPVQH